METLVYQLEDEFHCESLPGEFSSYEEALEEIKRIVALPFGVRPNNPPSTTGIQCQRDYIINKYSASASGELQFVEQVHVATSTATGVTWHVA